MNFQIQAESKLTNDSISETVLVDNTAPEILNFSLEAESSKINVSLTASDELCIIQAVMYSVDSAPLLRAANPVDMIADSSKEEFAFDFTTKENGLHYVTVLVTDIAGNKKIITHEFSN